MPQRFSSPASLAVALKLVETGHFGVAYASDDQRLAVLVPYLKLGIERGEQCIYVNSGGDPGARAALQASGIDVDSALRRGALVILRRSETALGDGEFDPLRLVEWCRSRGADAVQNGFTRLRLVDDVFQIAGGNIDPDLIGEMDARFDLLVRELSITGLCLFDRAQLAPAVVRQMLFMHPLVVSGDVVYRNPHCVPPDDYLSAPRPWSEIDWMLRSLRRMQESEEEQRASEIRYRDLARRIIDLQERERRTIARDLHEELGQLLTAILINLRRSDAGTSERLGETAALLDQALESLRELVQDLRPSVLDDLGVSDALSWYSRRETERAGLQLRADLQPVKVSADVETTCFRIAQEALTNVVRHAAATYIELVLRHDHDGVLLEVRDDGRGFAADGGTGQGIMGMHERAAAVGGRIEVTSRPGSGTVVRAHLPSRIAES